MFGLLAERGVPKEMSGKTERLKRQAAGVKLKDVRAQGDVRRIVEQHDRDVEQTKAGLEQRKVDKAVEEWREQVVEDALEEDFDPTSNGLGQDEGSILGIAR